MGDRADVDVLCRLLESGANVVSTAQRIPQSRPASTRRPRQRIEAACAAGGTSLHSTGSSPGFITEALPFVLTSLQRRLDHLLIEEFADMSSRNSPELIFDLMGFGRDPATSTRAASSRTAAPRSPARSRCRRRRPRRSPSTTVEATGEVAVARHDVDVAAGHVEAGTIGAQRMQVTGIRDGRPLLTFSANWYLTTDVEPAWDLRETGWHVLVEGDTPLDIDIRFPVPPTSGRRPRPA